MYPRWRLKQLLQISTRIYRNRQAITGIDKQLLISGSEIFNLAQQRAIAIKAAKAFDMRISFTPEFKVKIKPKLL